MLKKISVVLVSLFAFILMAVSASALTTPPFDSSVSGSKSLSVDECVNWLVSEANDPAVTADVLKGSYNWALVSGSNYVTATSITSMDGFGYQFFYDGSGTFTVDLYSGSNVTRIAGNSGSGTSEVGSDLSGIIGTVGTGVKGVFDMSQAGFNFILANNICMIFVSVGLAGAGIALIARAFRTARK